MVINLTKDSPAGNQLLMIDEPFTIDQISEILGEQDRLGTYVCDKSMSNIYIRNSDGWEKMTAPGIGDNTKAELTTGDEWTENEKTAARDKLGVTEELDKKQNKPGEWILKGTISGDETDRGNIDTGVTVDLTGCTEMFVLSSTTGTGVSQLLINNDVYLLQQIAINGTRYASATINDGAMGYEVVRYRYSTNGDVFSVGNAWEHPFSATPICVSDITKLYFNAPAVVTTCNIKIYAR